MSWLHCENLYKRAAVVKRRRGSILVFVMAIYSLIGLLNYIIEIPGVYFIFGV